MRALDEEAALPANTIIHFLSLLSTALACSYLWDCSQRGKEVGQLELQDITLHNGDLAIQSLLLSPRDCGPIFVETLSTKTIKGRGKVPPIPVPTYAPIDEQYSFLARLPTFLTVSAMAGFPVEKYIFRPESKDGNSYSQAALTSGQICNATFRHAEQGHVLLVQQMATDLTRPWVQQVQKITESIHFP